MVDIERVPSQSMDIEKADLENQLEGDIYVI